MDALDRLARTLRALPPSCGPVRLIGVDGHAGSGKSTFTARLATALATGDPGPDTESVPVLHLDDLASHAEPFAWTARFRSQLAGPLAGGRTGYYAPYNWTARHFSPPRALPPAPIVLIEGVGAGRRELRPLLAAVLWMERDAEGSWRRGRHRDGSGLSAFWDGWTVAETRHFADDPSRPFADVLVQECPQGYRMTPGPRATAGESQFLTLGDDTSAPNRPVGNLPQDCPNSA
ncbi:hypothetical protein ABT354_29940 [Streptomyces sp. NPDC000594]|uniref:uridine kinase family protein n=1 Tax=Streptomyces sp. NPDC000594 TaxID=3154261 RepID=UPI003334440C